MRLTSACTPCLLLVAGSVLAWQPTEFMIAVWGGPHDDATARALADAGFNTVMCPSAQLDICRAHGLQVIVRDATPEMVPALIDDPAIWGYWVQDEPKAEEFTRVAERVAAFHAADTAHPAYVNLMAWMDLDNYLSTVRPRFLSYDYYQWWWGSHNHIWRLKVHRAAALGAGLPLFCWVEANADRRWEMGEKGQTYLRDNQPKLRQSVYTSLAYGVKGIQWFNTYLVFNHAAGRRMLPELRPAGEDVKRLNGELAVLGPTLLGLRSVGVFDIPPGGRYTLALPDVYGISVRGADLVLGLFEDDSRTRYAMVVNKHVYGGAWTILSFADPVNSIDRLDRASGAWSRVPAERHPGFVRVELVLRPGDGELLRLGRMQDSPPGAELAPWGQTISDALSRVEADR